MIAYLFKKLFFFINTISLLIVSISLGACAVVPSSKNVQVHGSTALAIQFEQDALRDIKTKQNIASTTKPVVIDKNITGTECLTIFKNEYMEYRRRLDIKKQEDSALLIDPHNGYYRFIFDRFKKDLFTPDETLLKCAADNGDQLANYIIGIRLINGSDKIGDFGRGLIYIEKASQPKNSAPKTCYEIDKLNDYECKDGLPEANYIIGLIYGDCRVEYFKPDLAKKYLFMSATNGLPAAGNAYSDVLKTSTYKVSCYHH